MFSFAGHYCLLFMIKNVPLTLMAFFLHFQFLSGDCFAINEGKGRLEMRTAKDVILSEPVDNVSPTDIIDKTTHRDGAIYKKGLGFLKSFHITNRDESK
jgi:hypothetical protein